MDRSPKWDAKNQADFKKSSAGYKTFGNTLNRISAYLFFLAIALVPLPFGSHSPTSVAFWCIWLSFVALLCSTKSLRPAHFAVVCGLALLMALYCLVAWLQSIPNLSPQLVDPIWRTAADILHEKLRASASIVHNAAIFGLGSIFANLLALAIGTVLGADRRRARQILLAFGLSGAAYAIFGIASAVIEPGYVLWRPRMDYHGNVLGTFLNRNTAGAYFGSCGLIWLLMFCANLRAHLPPGELTLQKFKSYFAHGTTPDVVIPFCVFFLCLIALFMTGSRGGSLLSVAAYICGGLAWFWKDMRGSRTKILVFCLFLGGALVVMQLIGGALNQRLSGLGFSGESRIDTYRATLKMISTHPWLGVGLGCFAFAFPAYRTDTLLYGIWDMAHSTPLQLIAEVGWPMAGIVIVSWMGALLILLRGATRLRRERIVPLAALLIAAIGLTHTTVDFSLQIPGFAIVVMAVVGAGLGQSLTRSPSASETTRLNRP